MWKDVCRFWITLHSAAVLCTHLLMYVAAHTLHTVNILYGKTWSYQRQRRHFCALQRVRYSLTPLKKCAFVTVKCRADTTNKITKSLSNYGRFDCPCFCFVQLTEFDSVWLLLHLEVKSFFFLSQNLLSFLTYVKNACALIIICIFLLLLPLEFLLIMNKKQTKRHSFESNFIWSSSGFTSRSFIVSGQILSDLNLWCTTTGKAKLVLSQKCLTSFLYNVTSLKFLR